MFHSFIEVESFLKKRKNFGIKPGLQRVNYLLEKLNHPEKGLRIIHVAGTNGKGSTIQLMNDALITCGYQVGVFTSPSFTGICGHVLINNLQINRQDVVNLLNEMMPMILDLDKNKMHPTEFEIITVIAFLYFKDRTDFVLVETGMGGRFDTTNCVFPIISIITNVEKDHIQFLGKTIEEISTNKAGIIKQNCPVIIGEVGKIAENIIHREAKKKHAKIYQLFSDFTYVKNGKLNSWQFFDRKFEFQLSLKGEHQIHNATLAIMALELLRQKGFLISWNDVAYSLVSTTLPGRFEQVWHRPTIILDCAHNVAGANKFIQTVLEEFPNSEKHLLFAGFKDKQLNEMLNIISGPFAQLNLTTFKHERAASIKEMNVLDIDKMTKIISSWEDYLEEILLEENEQIVYFITGSLHFITLVRIWLINKKI
ncbi:bifunctional folylpolyglutamate synthase/dihydrofolate synthase [Pseudogracilibacillus sp. SO30301A]|uniref:bifunctional folylpolyglutamate synthase/dihydrofolate synthase n=1 Tax=Pseudogracilibacillus sp. SO30301A TaxID=3098291 RepID=UPI00300E3BEA